MARNFKGKKDYRDLTSDAQFYYEKLTKFINENLLFDVDIIDTIECLDNLIDTIREEYEKAIAEAYDRILELEEKIEELD